MPLDQESPPSARPDRQAEAYARRLLEGLGVPVLRRTVAAILEFEYGFGTAAVTDALGRLSASRGPITLSHLAFKGCLIDMNVYTFGRQPTAAELRYLRRACVRGTRFFPRRLFDTRASGMCARGYTRLGILRI